MVGVVDDWQLFRALFGRRQERLADAVVEGEAQRLADRAFFG